MISENRLTKEKIKEIIDEYFYLMTLICNTNIYTNKSFLTSLKIENIEKTINSFSRKEIKRMMAMQVYNGPAFCKIFYIQIASILEAIYFCLQKYIPENHSLYRFFQKKEYKAEIWKKMSQDTQGVRYLDLAYLVALSANVFKHNNGNLMKNLQGDYERSSKYLVDLMNKKLFKDDAAKFKVVLEKFDSEHCQFAYYAMEIQFDGINLSDYLRVTSALYILRG